VNKKSVAQRIKSKKSQKDNKTIVIKSHLMAGFCLFLKNKKIPKNSNEIKGIK